MSSELIKHITDDTFKNDVLESDVPVLVDYWAEWCGPCKMIAPILDEMAKDYGGRLQIAKMNVDDNREVPGKFGIRGIPTLMIFKGGQVVGSLTGARPKRELTAFIDGHLSSARLSPGLRGTPRRFRVAARPRIRVPAAGALSGENPLPAVCGPGSLSPCSPFTVARGVFAGPWSAC